MAHSRSAVNRIETNDRNQKHISVFLRTEPSDWDLERAFQRNTIVDSITVHCGGAQLNAYPLLANDIIATRVNLTKLELRAEERPRLYSTTEALLLQFWAAARLNPSIKEIPLFGFQFVSGSDLFTSLCTNISASTLVLSGCSMMEPDQREQGARALAAATNVQKLEISNCEEVFTRALLHNLSDNTSVQTLAIGFLNMDANNHLNAIATCQLLETTTTIQRFELLRCEDWSSEQFLSIASVLTESESVTGFKIADSEFPEAAPFQSILLNKRNLESLSIQNVSFGDNDVQAVYALLATALTARESPLRHLEIRKGQHLPVDNERFQPLLRAVEKSKLKSFAIGDLASQEQLKCLADSIPKLRVQKFELTATDEFAFQEMEQRLLCAITDNLNLRSVRGFIISRQIRRSRRHREPPQPQLMFDQDDERRRLASCLIVHRWAYNKTDDPNSVQLEQKLFPLAIAMAEKAGNNTLYASLRSRVDYLASLAPSRRVQTPPTQELAHEEEAMESRAEPT